MTTAYDFKLPGLGGGELDFADFRDTVVLVVNVASECGLTPQYSQLQALQQRYSDRGFTVVGIPCNQFLGQEPGSDEDIQAFCSSQYGVTFPMSGKLDVNGDNRAPLYRWLSDEEHGFAGDIEWNFAKILINRYDDVVNRFPPETEPEAEAVIEAIEACL
jgi:glutathione peroxidase